MPQHATVALLSQRRSLYCLRLGEFTGFERARRSWVTQLALRRHVSSRGANSCLNAVFCSRFLLKSRARAIPSHAPSANSTKPFRISIGSTAPFFLVIRLVLALHFFKALLTSKGVDRVVPDDSDADEPVLPPGSQSHGARGTGEGLSQVGWTQAG